LRGQGDKRGLRILLDNGDSILARPRSMIVCFDPEAPINAFYSKTAQRIEKGDYVCLLSDSLMTTIKEMLGSGAAVAARVREYHRFVANKVQEIPGPEREKIRHITALMSQHGCKVSEAAVEDWIRAERYLEEDELTVQPHAPRDYEYFKVFMDALG